VGEERRKYHNNILGIGCGDVFTFRRSPLEHLTVGKKSIDDQFEDLTLICGGLFEHLRMGGSHGAWEENLGEDSTAQGKQMESARKEEKWRRHLGMT
jgi:hypothetical protein